MIKRTIIVGYRFIEQTTTFSMRASIIFSFALFPLFVSAQSFDLAKELEGNNLKVHNRTITQYEQTGIEMDAQQSDGLTIINTASFETGVIELEIKGENNPGKSFVGFAFNIQNDSTYEAIYFRPFNFVAEAPARRSHMVQYIYHPGYTWYKLREERTDEFENEIQSPPNPDGWFKAKIVVSDKSVSVFIEGRNKPELAVKRLSDGKTDRVGLWTGFGSSGRFKNLKITKGD